MIKLRQVQFLIITAPLLLCQTYLIAAPADSLANSRPKSALQLDLINSTGFAFLMPVTPSMRLRFGLNANIQSNSGNNNYSRIYQAVNPDTAYTQQTSEPQESHYFSATTTFSAIFFNDFFTSGPCSLYAGLGPFATYSRYYNSSKYTYINGTGYDEQNDSNYSWTYGARAALGIQIVIIKEIGIHAEYSCSVGHQKSTSNGISTSNNTSRYFSSSTDNSNSSGTTWIFSGVTAGLLFFF